MAYAIDSFTVTCTSTDRMPPTSTQLASASMTAAAGMGPSPGSLAEPTLKVRPAVEFQRS